MDLDELKNIIAQDGGKIIVVEQGKPIMVVVSYEEYQRKHARGEPPHASLVSSPSPSHEELSIDDLPLS
jgi:prevent-host-death family protein